MSIIEPGSAGAGLVARVKAILTKPAETWDVIDTEQTSTSELYRGYVMILAAIPAICGAIGIGLIGVGGFGFSIKLPLVWALSQGVVSYILGLVMVFVIAVIIDELAPNFGGVKNRGQALKVSAYSWTAAWVAGVFTLLPALGVVALLGGLYSLYTLYLGLPKLMKVPQERAGGYFAVVLVVAILVGLVCAAITNSVTSFGRAGALASAGALGGATIKTPNGSVDLAKLEAAGKAAELAAKQVQDGSGPPPTDPDVLKGYLPTAIGGFTRTEVSSSTGGVGGIQGSGAEGHYTKGDASLKVEVLDLGSAGALAGMAGAFNVKSSKETATGYEKVGKVDGRLTQESYDTASKHGEYSVLVADRFMIQVSGDGVSMDELKGAVGAIGTSRLEGLAKGG